ncbi:DUF2497 domain-containing protein [Roseococcus thiosulfatophilus]|uniref:DUF2497 domain-containing protein n=1 Tax=Roseococcus thiosulfatophilus TaxID=35813 RepID=UPI001A905902|nr:DUF2497 domain-containing protein [Roseococcus thiosulfatophilus]
MDDILASIRKILNEDEAQPAAATAPAAVEAVEEALDLTPDMMITSPEVAPPPTPPQLLQMEPAPMPPPPAPMPEPQAASTLVSAPAAAAAAAALGQLSRAVAQDRASIISRAPGLSIEDVVREELRPLLKEWLDTHLPPLVERLVRAEIERVMSRAG